MRMMAKITEMQSEIEKLQAGKLRIKVDSSKKA